MRRIILFLFLPLLIVSCTSVTEYMNYYIGEDLSTKNWNNEYGMPLIYYQASRDTPIFILYENGQLICGIYEENGKIVYYEVLLSKGEIDDIFTELHIPKNRFFERNNVNAQSTWVTDLSTTALIINKDYQKVITMYGSLGNMDEWRKKYHKKLLNIYDAIINYRNQDAKKWIPEYIEFILFKGTGKWSFEKITYEWPENFPDLYSSTTIEFERCYILFIPKELYTEFMDYMTRIEEKNNLLIRDTIAINGKEMMFGYKIPLPNIKFWRLD